MKIKKNGQVIRLTESDLQRIAKRVLTEGIVYTDGRIEKVVELGNKGNTIENVKWEKEGEEVVGIRITFGSGTQMVIKK